ncbi:hypothetical protein QFZ65_003281 [Arthrobacter sp. B3I9]|uniref:hypothetical protein n=1 Tax=Arthrobacter sp. B3I9 TaxID=3042270 RepID=UPI002793ECE1|nr:hypothetical protein [Arthrobacter sp. B3I9]MDQ0851343.1 hypothetical protein [Arthrobacter sp. B3I9]
MIGSAFRSIARSASGNCTATTTAIHHSCQTAQRWWWGRDSRAGRSPRITEDLLDAGREVHLSVSTCPEAPRRYRGQDISYWLLQVNLHGPDHGINSLQVGQLPSPAARFQCNPLISGNDGGHSIRLRDLDRRGVRLHGQFEGTNDGVLVFSDDLPARLAQAEAGFVNTSGTVIAGHAVTSMGDRGSLRTTTGALVIVNLQRATTPVAEVAAPSRVGVLPEPDEQRTPVGCRSFDASPLQRAHRTAEPDARLATGEQRGHRFRMGS